jgi:hypothetical protein
VLGQHIANHGEIPRHKRARTLAVREDKADHDDIVSEHVVIELQAMSVLVDDLDVREVVAGFRLGSGRVGLCCAGNRDVRGKCAKSGNP